MRVRFMADGVADRQRLQLTMGCGDQRYKGYKVVGGCLLVQTLGMADMACTRSCTGNCWRCADRDRDVMGLSGVRDGNTGQHSRGQPEFSAQCTFFVF